jgi:midasin
MTISTLTSKNKLALNVINSNGSLVFQYGLLVQALRNKYWLILGESNLAPSEVLEALNRLIDDDTEKIFSH